jgi:hypothetical protein
MNNLRIDSEASFDLIMSTDALFAIFYDEPYLDDSCVPEINSLLQKYPLGLELIEYELIPDDYRAVVTVAPYIEDEFQAEYFLALTQYISCQIKLDGDYVIYRLVKTFTGLPEYGDPKRVTKRINPFGLEYFSFDDDDRSMIYLREFKKVLA